MLGFFIGAACLFGLIKVIRMGRYGYGGYGYGHGGWGGFRGGHHACHGGSHHGHDNSGPPWRGGYGRGGFGPRVALRALFERLDTTPGQEKVIAQALEDLWEKKRVIADEFVQTRKDVARAMRGGAFDEAALQEAFGRQDELLVQLRATAQVAFKTVHDALDERQRGIAADLLENGPFGRHGGGAPPWTRGGGPYREASWM
jgi:uncharacterized membrane protein